MSIRINKGTSLINQGPGDYGTYTLADKINLYEIQRTNNFEFVISDLAGLLKSGFAESDSGVIRTPVNSQEIIRLSVVSSTVPSFSQRPIEVKRGNSILKYAGTPEFSSGTLVINDFVGIDTIEILQAWQNQSYNVRTEKVGLAIHYKKNCTLNEYSPDYQLVRSMTIYGCWIGDLTQDDFNNETNNKHTIRATIHYDKAIPNANR